MDTLIIHSDSSKTKAIAAFLKAFDVSFEIKKESKKSNESPYDPAFVKMVLEARKGKTKRINPHDLWESIL